MALYREGKAAMAADGTVTGTGTKWQSSLSLIRPGATIMFLSSPIQIAVVNKVVSDTEIKAITTNGAVVASTDYAILLSDSLTVDGLAQDVAETLRYYQSQETVIADAVEFFKNFDFDSLQNLANQIKADSEAAGASATAAASSASAAAYSESAAKSSETAAKASETEAKAAMNQTQQIINDAGEQSTLVALAQPDGFEKIGQADFMSTLKDIEPVINGQEILVRQHNPSAKIGGGVFFYDQNDTMTEDNNCTVVVTTGGKRWKRKGVTDKIYMEWAGVRTVSYTEESQDDALDNCIKAAAVGSRSGYACREIIGPMFDRVRLSRKHYLRGGVYPLATGAGQITNPVDGRTGISGRFVMEKGAGIYCVQTIGVNFWLFVDNYGQVSEDKAPSINNGDYILRLEAYNQNAYIDMEAQSYGGTGLHSLGKSATAENSAIWPDLTDDYQGINNLTGGRYNFRNCGRGFYLDNNLSGVGSLGEVWEQWSTGNSVFSKVADVAFSHYETSVVHNAAALKGTVLFNNCGKISFKELNLGSGGKPLCAFNNCSSVQIGQYYAVHGETYSVSEATYMRGMEVANSVIQIGSAYLSGPNGVPFIIGKGGSVYLGSLFGSNINCIAILTNSADYLTTFAASTDSPTWKSFAEFKVGSGKTLYMNRRGYVVSSRPSVLITSDMAQGTYLDVSNLNHDFPHQGFESEEDTAYIRCESNFAKVNANSCNFEGLTYPIYCRDYYNIGLFSGNDMIDGMIKFSSGSTSIVGGSCVSVTGVQLLPGGNVKNTSKNIIEYSFRYTISPGGNLQVTKNGKEIAYSPTSSENKVLNVNATLRPGESLSCTSNNSSLITLSVTSSFVRLF